MQEFIKLDYSKFSDFDTFLDFIDSDRLYDILFDYCYKRYISRFTSKTFEEYIESKLLGIRAMRIHDDIMVRYKMPVNKLILKKGDKTTWRK